MAHNIYKYSSAGILALMFDREGYCGIKCSFPKDYNDPYELFLGVDLDGSTESLATYQEIVHEIPQHPTTCFSQSPTVVPMWAHYANTHTGFVLEFDVKAIESKFEDATVGEVKYRDAPDPDIEYMLMRSAITTKPRHAVWLQQGVISQAYFSKQTAWAYEQEVRLVARPDYIEEVSGNMVLFVPVDCLKRIIVGSNASSGDVALSKEIADKHGLDWLQSKIGKSTPHPFFLNEAGSVFVFKDGEIVEADNACAKCSEPIGGEEELCAWCKITGDHAYAAARANPLRMLDRYGMLDDYMRSVEAIERDIEE